MLLPHSSPELDFGLQRRKTDGGTIRQLCDGEQKGGNQRKEASYYLSTGDILDRWGCKLTSDMGSVQFVLVWAELKVRGPALGKWRTSEFCHRCHQTPHMFCPCLERLLSSLWASAGSRRNGRILSTRLEEGVLRDGPSVCRGRQSCRNLSDTGCLCSYS